MKFWLILATAVALAISLVPIRAADDEDKDDGSAKAALQALNDFIGEWKGSGSPEKARPGRGEKRWSWTCGFRIVPSPRFSRSWRGASRRAAAPRPRDIIPGASHSSRKGTTDGLQT